MQHDSEEIERLALEDLHAGASSELRRALHIRSDRIGAAFVSSAAALPASAIVINRAIGVGLRQAESAATVDAMLEAYRSAEIARFFIQVHPDAQPKSLAQMLQARGLERARGWQKFGRGREPIARAETNLRVEKIDAAHAGVSARIVCDAFDLGDDAQAWLRLLATRPKWHIFMSFDGDEPAGSGALFIDGDTAWTDFGATAPAFRQRGSQSALLRERVTFALDQGCKNIYTCTGEEVPGDPQHSYANILKCGFREAYVRLNFAPPKR